MTPAADRARWLLAGAALLALAYFVLLPALFIAMAVLSFNFFGDGLRDALDPRTERIFARRKARKS